MRTSRRVWHAILPVVVYIIAKTEALMKRFIFRAFTCRTFIFRALLCRSALFCLLILLALTAVPVRTREYGPDSPGGNFGFYIPPWQDAEESHAGTVRH